MIVIGVVAAAVGILITVGFFMPTTFFVKNADLENQNQEFLKTSLGIKAYGRLEIFEFLDKALPSMATVYKKKNTSGADKFYIARDRLGFASVITSDGWLVTSKSVLSGWDVKNTVIAVRGAVYGAPKIVVADAWTDVVFIKIEANGLPVMSLGDSGAVGLGDIAFIGKDKNNFWFSYVDALNYYAAAEEKNSLVVSSEEYGKSVKLQNDVPADFNGAMLIDRFGEAIGLVTIKNQRTHILPINYFKSAISEVLKNKKITHAYFGANYIDLSYVVSDGFQNKKGAYLFGGAVRAIAPGSPAAKAGLLQGDIVLKVEGDEVNEQNNLTELLSQYAPGEKINLRILRAGKEMDAVATLE
jgi:serine protease Do